MISIKRALRGAVGPLVAGALLASGAGLAVAGTSYSNFSTTVGKLNGNGYTGTQTKSGSGTNGNITTTSVGGSYQVDAQLQKSDGSSSGSWKKSLVAAEQHLQRVVHPGQSEQRPDDPGGRAGDRQVAQQLSSTCLT